MSVTTDQELLAAVNSAIEAILTGAQSASINGRSYSRASLSELYKMRTRLETKIARGTRGSGKAQIRFRRS